MKFLVLFSLIAVGVSADFLTLDEANLLRTSWDTIKHNEVDILYAVFKAYPDIQAKFPMFTGKDLDTIKGTPEFALHSTRIVSFISEIISLSGSESNIVAIRKMVKQLSNTHNPRGVTKAQFTEFRTAVTNYAATHATWGDNVAAIWNRAIENVYAILFADLEE